MLKTLGFWVCSLTCLQLLLDFEVTLKRNGLSIKTETRIKKRTVGVPEGLNSQLPSEVGPCLKYLGGRDDLFNSSEVFLQDPRQAVR